MTILTKNTDKLRSEVAAHVAADSIVQGIYWDKGSKRGCFIGCLAKRDDPSLNEATYGLPVMVQRIAENIFEALPANEAKAFFAALPDAVGCDGKDLTRVGWQFLAAELRCLPAQSAELQAVIDTVIAGMDLLASGQEWSRAAAARSAANAATGVAWWAFGAADAADNAAAAAELRCLPAQSAELQAAAAARAAAKAAIAAVDADAAAARLRQRDLLLRLISEAPVVENHQ